MRLLDARENAVSNATLTGRRGALPARLASLLWFAATIALTFLGLLAVTFFIGRVVPIDPVLAIVGGVLMSARNRRAEGNGAVPRPRAEM